MTTIASSAAPASAIRIWREGIDLLVEFPSASGIPYIMRIADTASAVGKVLDLIHGARPKPLPRRGLPERHPQVRKVTPSDSFSVEQRANARAVLKRMGIT